MGFASSPETRDTLATHGIRVTGWTWRWAPGLKNGTYPPHHEINGHYAPTADQFEYVPGEHGVVPMDRETGDSTCMCRLVPVYRTPDGRFAKPGLEPVFTPPIL